MTASIEGTAGWDAVLVAARPRVRQFCVRLLGDESHSDDVTQEVLLRVWRAHRRPPLDDPEQCWRWLRTIARNECRRWMGRWGQVTTPFPSAGAHDDEGRADDLPDAYDLERDLERHELVGLLDRALAVLPPDTRQVLIERYVEESPQAETALRLGVSVGAVAMRLQRGKVALRRVLANDLRDAALGYGQVKLEAAGWQRTRLWCPNCGRHLLDGQFAADRGELLLRCKVCCPEPATYLSQAELPRVFAGLRSCGPAARRLEQWADRYYTAALLHGTVPCMGCGGPADIQHCLPADAPLGWTARTAQYCLHTRCPRCAALCCESLPGLARCHPASRRFRLQYGRLRTLPPREETVASQPAIVVRLEALTASARLTVAFARDTYAPLGVWGDATDD